MAIPGHEFLTAHFSNNDRTTVESYWITPDGKETRVEYIEAKEGDTNWENLLTHIDIDTLHEATYKHIRQQNEAFEDDVIKIAKERGMIYDVDELSSDVYKICTHLLFQKFDEVADKEKLFLYKLQLFEVEAVKECKDAVKKKELRQAKSLIEATKVVISIIES
tara:strand:- start:770 stop:1261 length:492 start_codon:yes stop_codon:yes gene_type:complete